MLRLVLAGVVCFLLAVVWGVGMLLFMLIAGVNQLNGWPPVVLAALGGSGAILSLGGLTVLLWQTLQEEE